MNAANPIWHFSAQRHTLKDAVLELVKFESVPSTEAHICSFCSIDFTKQTPMSGPLLVFKSQAGLLVCQDCFCEHKDDFNWQTFDGLA